MREKSRQPVILLVGDCGKEYDFIKNWLESNEFSTRETADVYEVLDEISDFTVRRCPDVFMLQATSQSGDFNEINELVQTFSDCSDILVACVSGEEKSADSKNTSQPFSKTEANLNALLPALSRAAANNRF
ncbi:MAG: hypothetical protein M3Q99_06805 [Acidobacteriota bacterium]|nr:hypothetical protein [Acidobacteriota bacterium]